ncbi:MAG: hypothetical protein EAZ60_10220 [Oscillatoriales cyanobacterium]|nr:MAG: hypothetical protein EAZ79_21440 [Oscillatoriales cyanobacterium]TAF56299.1 MAG: hypothetical protein EAZ60_10220 [Oscillatoriales cyanobacterium]
MSDRVLIGFEQYCSNVSKQRSPSAKVCGSLLQFVTKTHIADRVMSSQRSGKFQPNFFGAEALEQKRTRVLCFDSRGNGAGIEKNP